jgi:hypothetical protein
MKGDVQIDRFIIAGHDIDGKVRVWDSSPGAHTPAGILIDAPRSVIVKCAREAFDFWCLNALRDSIGLRVARLRALQSLRRSNRASGWKLGDGWRVRTGRTEAPQLGLAFRAEPFALRGQTMPARPAKRATRNDAAQLAFDL